MPGLIKRLLPGRRGALAAIVILAALGLPGHGHANTVTYTCQDGIQLNAILDNQAGTLRLEIGDNVVIILNTAVSGSGMRFTGYGYEAYGKADWLNVVRPEAPELRCQQIGVPASPPPLPAPPQYTAPQPAPQEPQYASPEPEPQPAPKQTASPSFSCKGRLNASEVRLCSNPTLANLEREMASVYRSLRRKLRRARRGQLKQEQIKWLKQRSRCGSNDQCIEDELSGRIAYLNSYR